MIHRRYHRNNRFSVGKAKNGNLGACEELLNNNSASACAEDPVLHHGVNGVKSLVEIFGDYNTLAERKSVRLDNRRESRGFKIVRRRFGSIKNLVACGGNIIFFHQVFGENLTALDRRRLCLGTEARNTDFVQSVNGSENKRIVGSYNSIIDLVFTGKIYNSVNILCADRNTSCVLGNSAVTGQSKDFLNRSVFL